MQRGSYYMLRRCLVPWRAEEIIAELEQYCPKNKIDEVAWTIEGEEFNKGLSTLESIKNHLPWIEKAKDRLAILGVKTSIYAWATLNHADRGRDGSTLFPDIQWMVDCTGATARFCACPLSPAWQEYIVKAYQLYASIEPEILWIDDDFRMFNHSPVTFGCFCPIHLKVFSERVGRKISREELVENILAPGKPHADRSLWLNFLGDTMVEVAGMLEKAVHNVSPKTRLGLMTSHPWDHSLEGRNWDRLLKALAGPYQPVIRPTAGSYNEASSEGIHSGADVLRRTIFCLPEETRICPEIENWTYTRFSKSARFTRLQIGLAQAMKVADVTLGIYDHMGTPMDFEPAYGRMLQESKPFFDALASWCLPGGKERGVGVIHHPRASDYVHTAGGKDFRELYPHDDGWQIPIQACGIPVTFESSEVMAITGQVLRAFKKEDIISLLSKGILLDGSALEVLIEEGYGEYLGVSVKRWLVNWDVPLAAEKITDREFSKDKEVYITLSNLTTTQRLVELIPAKEAKVISVFINQYNHEVMPGMALFKNRLGGRIAIYPFDLSDKCGRSFLNWHRKAQLSTVIKWLGGYIPLFVEGGAQMLPLRLDYREYTFVAIANLSSDTWESVTITIDEREGIFGKIEMITDKGELVKAPISEQVREKGMLKVKFATKLENLELASFLFFKNK